MSKGSEPRPLSISKDEFDKNWDAIDWGEDLPPIPRFPVKIINIVNDNEDLHNSPSTPLSRGMGDRLASQSSTCEHGEGS